MERTALTPEALAEQWEDGLREQLVVLIVGQMGASYEKAVLMIYGKAGPVLVREVARVLRERIGGEKAVRFITDVMLYENDAC